MKYSDIQDLDEKHFKEVVETLSREEQIELAHEISEEINNQISDLVTQVKK